MEQQSSSQFDVIIIGGAAAGFSAAIFSARRQLKTLVITKNVGGQLTLTDSIENYPGVLSSSGLDLVQNMALQAESFGAKMHHDEVTSILREGDRYVVKTPTHAHRASVLILAFGKTPRDLKIPGEDALKGKGVSHCIVCDGIKYKGKAVVVTGSGNSAIEAAIYASKICERVYLVRRSSIFGGEKLLIEILKKSPNVEFLDGYEVAEVHGIEAVEAVTVKKLTGEGITRLPVAALFVEIGFESRPSIIKDLVQLNEKNEIVVDKNNRTSTPFVYAAGDATDGYYKQTVISAGEGARAALAAYDDIMRAQGRLGMKGDWLKMKKKSK